MNIDSKYFEDVVAAHQFANLNGGANIGITEPVFGTKEPVSDDVKSLHARFGQRIEDVTDKWFVRVVQEKI